MTIKVQSKAALDVASWFYEMMEETINDEEIFSSVLTQDSITFYITPMPQHNRILNDSPQKINLTMLCTVLFGGIISVTIALWGLCCNEKKAKKPKFLSEAGNLGIAAASPYWLELNSTSSSLSFESTTLPSNVIDSLSPCDDNISDLSFQSSNSGGQFKKLGKIEEIEEGWESRTCS
jgi:hypothetical protein